MMQHDLEPDDAPLRSLLRTSLPTPSLRPRFQESVWNRIETQETRPESSQWLDAILKWTLRPRFATVAAIVLVAAGVLVGAQQGSQAARHEAQMRYLASIAPNPLR